MHDYDVIVLGGGAAGLMAAITAGGRGRRVLLIEASNKLGKKILMSGGGRCNFTNLDVTANHFICRNPHFVKSALAQYTQWDFISLVNQHKIAYHEKTLGQLFCDNSAKDILAMLVEQCTKANVTISLNHTVESVTHNKKGYTLTSNNGRLSCQSLIVATGGLSIPTLGGATGFGYTLAEQFGHDVYERHASLVPFTLSGKLKEFSHGLSGLALPVKVSVPAMSFTEDMLFTHRGISGPAILQLSNYWKSGRPIQIDLLPSADDSALMGELTQAKIKHANSLLVTNLANLLPTAFAKAFIAEFWPQLQSLPMQQIKNAQLQSIVGQLKGWTIKPSGTEGYRTAEVTMGGVSTSQISSKTMECNNQPGLYFVGEVLDVTGHLGGYNFQWAWSSGYVAGLNA